MKLDDMLRLTLEVTPLPVGIRALTDDDIVHVYDNPASAALSGYSSTEDLVGRTYRELGVSADHLRLVLASLRQAQETGKPVRQEIAYETRQGPRQLIKRYAPVPGHRDEAGRPLFICVAEDVTELRSLQAGIQRLDRLSTLGTLTAALGHELASPLTAVTVNIAMCRSLTEHGEVTDPQGKLDAMLADAQEACEHLTTVLVTMREFGRGGSGERAPIPVREALETALRLGGATLRDGVKVAIEGGPDVIVVGGKVAVAQVLLNLLMNGARAAREKHREGGAQLTVGWSTRGRDVVIDVSDNGGGLSAEVAKRIFEPFVTTHSESGGTGLGLFVARRFAEGAGGSLVLLDAPSGGVTGRLTLPRAGAPVP